MAGIIVWLLMLLFTICVSCNLPSGVASGFTSAIVQYLFSDDGFSYAWVTCAKEKVFYCHSILKF